MLIGIGLALGHYILQQNSFLAVKNTLSAQLEYATQIQVKSLQATLEHLKQQTEALLRRTFYEANLSKEGVFVGQNLKAWIPGLEALFLLDVNSRGFIDKGLTSQKIFTDTIQQKLNGVSLSKLQPTVLVYDAQYGLLLYPFSDKEVACAQFEWRILKLFQLGFETVLLSNKNQTIMSSPHQINIDALLDKVNFQAIGSPPMSINQEALWVSAIQMNFGLKTIHWFDQHTVLEKIQSPYSAYMILGISYTFLIACFIYFVVHVFSTKLFSHEAETPIHSSSSNEPLEDNLLHASALTQVQIEVKGQKTPWMPIHELAQKLFSQKYDFDDIVWEQDKIKGISIENSGLFSSHTDSLGDFWVFTGETLHGPMSELYLDANIVLNSFSEDFFYCQKRTMLGWKKISYRKNILASKANLLQAQEQEGNLPALVRTLVDHRVQELTRSIIYGPRPVVQEIPTSSVQQPIERVDAQTVVPDKTNHLEFQEEQVHPYNSKSKLDDSLQLTDQEMIPSVQKMADINNINIVSPALQGDLLLPKNDFASTFNLNTVEKTGDFEMGAMSPLIVQTADTIETSDKPIPSTATPKKIIPKNEALKQIA